MEPMLSKDDMPTAPNSDAKTECTPSPIGVGVMLIGRLGEKGLSFPSLTVGNPEPSWSAAKGGASTWVHNMRSRHLMVDRYGLHRTRVGTVWTRCVRGASDGGLQERWASAREVFESVTRYRGRGTQYTATAQCVYASALSACCRWEWRPVSALHSPNRTPGRMAKRRGKCPPLRPLPWWRRRCVVGA